MPPPPQAASLAAASHSHSQSLSQSQPSYHGPYHDAYHNHVPSDSTSAAARFPPQGPLGGTSAGRGGRSASESGPAWSATPTATLTSNFSSQGHAARSRQHLYTQARSGSVSAASANGLMNGHAAGYGTPTPDLAADYQGSRNPKGLNLNLLDHQRTDETLSGPANNPTPSSYLAAGVLPRSSSLLPPPRNFVNSQAGLVHPYAKPDTIAEVEPEPEPSSFLELLTPRQPPAWLSHSRASSTGGVSDGFRNLNRWSASTSSSRASNWGGEDQQQPQQPSQQRPPNFSRRMSVDSVALSPSYLSPRKLIKRRPSNASVSASVSPESRAPSSASVRARHSSPPPQVPTPNIPPSITLPSLGVSDVDYTRPSPNPPGGVATPGSVVSNQAKDYFWNDLADHTKADHNSNSASPAGTRENTSGLLPAASIDRERDADNMQDKRGHSRSRSSAAKASTDSTKANARGKQPSQKAMLSKALAKANTAVQLDNAQNYEGARESYIEACDLLHQVLARTTGEDDKKKLEAIRRTYSSRIEELDGMVPPQAGAGKALPARPESLDHNGNAAQPGVQRGAEENMAMGFAMEAPAESASQSQAQRQAARPPGPEGTRGEPTTNLTPGHPSHSSLQSSFSRSPMRRNFEGTLNVPLAAEGSALPPPLSPRRLHSPTKAASPEVVRQDSMSIPPQQLAPPANISRGHSRNPSKESVSFYLDKIDESEGSQVSSLHSRTSSLNIRRKHIRAPSGTSDPAFDAELDAAVEAAYDDGYEPTDAGGTTYEPEVVVANALRKVELAKERVRQTDRETAIELAREREQQRKQRQSQDSETFGSGFYENDSEEEEEERMLDEMTKIHAMQDFTFNQPSSSQSNPQRESDSSAGTQRTWHSSTGSGPPTATTVLSTVNEVAAPRSKTPPPSSLPPPPPPPPTAALPELPPNVRARRLSGQNPKQLKIETSKVAPPPAVASAVAAEKKPGSYIAAQRQAMSATTARAPFSGRGPSSPTRTTPPAATAPPTPPHYKSIAEEAEDAFTSSPTHPGLRRNQSTSSLKSLRTRQQSVPYIDMADMSPNTPSTSAQSNNPLLRQPTLPPMPTPTTAAFRDKMNGASGGLYLFEDFHSPLPSPSTAEASPDGPMALEPCPSDVTLRPFWLMRALYQTLANPRGGYLTNRLFVPRDVWKVKGVKLRSLEDKTAQCDLLTAALLKLARVDSNDADAVLEEMQSLENMLEQVQVTLTRKLGNEVGTAGMNSQDAEPAPSMPRTASVSVKGGAFSWRRLRNKNSAANMASAYNGKGFNNNATSDRDPLGGERTVSLASLPMAANASSRPAKRDVAAVKFDGPFGGYMESLARLFDAAQTLDQIARQVDDPGLRHADKTQVGLELCTRHAAEFFGFYICRFVLADLGLLLDKYVKRSTEWVLT